MGQRIVSVNHGTHDLLFFFGHHFIIFSLPFHSSFIGGDVFLSTFHHLVTI